MQFDSPPFLALTQILAEELGKATAQSLGLNQTQVRGGDVWDGGYMCGGEVMIVMYGFFYGGYICRER